MESGYLLDRYLARFGQAVRRQGNGWNGPCPLCGGEPGKSDRFMVWPDRAENLGEICVQHNIVGIWSCRKCGESGDTIAWLTKCEGMTFRDALAELGIEAKKPQFQRRLAPPAKTAPSEWAPKILPQPSVKWVEQAVRLVEKAEAAIWNHPQTLAWLAQRGIDEEAVRKYRIGYLEPESEKYQGIFRPRALFGLEPKTGADGRKKDRIFIPRGILIPTLGKSGSVLNLRIRRHQQDLHERAPKYLELEGSYRGPLFLESSLPRHLGVYFIVEAELDAILIHHASAGIAGAIAVRTNRGKPDSRCASALEAAVRICVALDYDDAGAEGCDFWECHYPSSLRWPVPEGKDPGDAFRLGVDIRAWIDAALPESVRLPEAGAASGIITQPGEDSEIIPHAGNMDMTLPGLDILGEGGPEFDEAREEKRAGYYFDINDRFFTDSQRRQIRGACPGDMLRGVIPFEAVCAWLQWLKTPDVKFSQASGKFEPKNGGLAGFYANAPGFALWLDRHPDPEITPANFFRS